MKLLTIIVLFLLTCPAMGQYPANIVVGQIQASGEDGENMHYWQS